ncbi:MAG: hypothetical protein MJ077_07975 [Oscillospiraceae bacterium]|nr:hypothetical protein [Oscillospiraceae bacterium]
MMYISKGAVLPNSTEDLIRVSHQSLTVSLTRTEAALWFNGRDEFTSTESRYELNALDHLRRMNLVEYTDGSDLTAQYRTLTRCMPCVSESHSSDFGLGKHQRHMMRWLRHAGLHLTVAELVKLRELDLAPSDDLLYEKNRQALTETLYTLDTIEDNVLENLMEHSAAMPQTIKTLLSLLKKNRIYLV